MITALDTETQDGYAILITKAWSFVEPRSFEDCINYLEQDRELACWNADYDIQAIMKWLPWSAKIRLGILNEVVWSNYQIRYIPHKFCRVWRRQFATDDWKLLFTVYDMRQFYNCALKIAAKKLGVAEKGEIPHTWYRSMQARLKDPRTRNRVLSYAMQDAQTLQAIIRKTEESFALAGMKFERPFSNASFAERYFASKFRYRRNYEVERYAERAYHGGRIECLMTGYFKRAYHYDIHSAYPKQIAELVKPDGEWIYEANPNTIRNDAVYAFIDCECNIPRSRVRSAPIPFRRRNGNIFYPVGTFRKTITLREYQYLHARGWVRRIFSAWVHIWPKWSFPFREIASLYSKRKADPRVDYALKIVMNSVYGKLAQVIEMWIRTNRVDANSEIFDDRVWKRKRTWKGHTSFVYAAEITARTRLALLEIPPEHVICYATDGVFTTKPINLKTGSGLGEWSEVEEVRDLIVVGSGVYSYREDPFNTKGKTVVKFRGFNPQMDLPGLLKKAGRRHFISLRVLRNTSLKLAAKGPQWKDRLNVLEEHKRYLDVNFDKKRKWPKRWNARELTRKQFDSKPLIYWGTLRVKR